MTLEYNTAGIWLVFSTHLFHGKYLLRFFENFDNKKIVTVTFYLRSIEKYFIKGVFTEIALPDTEQLHLDL